MTAVKVKPRKKKVVTYTTEQKQAYKEKMLSEQKEMFESALRNLASADSWAHWIKYGRNNLRRLTLNNALMIWSQNPQATVVWGRKQWEKKNVTVNPDAKGVRYFAPAGFFVYKDANGDPLLDANGNQRRGCFFRVVTGYDISETDANPADHITNLTLDGDEMMDHLAPLEQLAREAGYSVDYAAIKDASERDDRAWKIVVNRDLSGNDLVRELLRNVVQVAGEYKFTADYDATEVAVITESAAVMILGMYGFDITEASVPYIQAVTKGDEQKTVEKFMKLVETLVNEITEKMEG